MRPLSDHSSKVLDQKAKLSSDSLSGRKYVAPLLLISRYRPQSLNILTNSLFSRLQTQSSESLTVAKQSFLDEILALNATHTIFASVFVSDHDITEQGRFL